MSEQPEDRASDRPEIATAPAAPHEAAEPSRPRERRIPAHLGPARTSTVILSILFLAIGFLYLNVRPDPVRTAQTGGDTGVEQPATPTPTTPPTTTAPPTTTEPLEPTTGPTEPTTTEPTGTTTPEGTGETTTAPVPPSEPPAPPTDTLPGG